MRIFFYKLSSFRWYVKVIGNMLFDKITPHVKQLALFDPSIKSDNLGDEIISLYSIKVLSPMLADNDILRLPTHVMPEKHIVQKLSQYKYKIVCGTNLMTPHFENYSIWKIPNDLRGYIGVITLAVGWEYYCDDISKYSRMIYKKMLKHNGLHSVRDKYTEKKFHEMGIHNVIYTGCVTLWEMTPERCAAIPSIKAQNVVTTVTDYSKNPAADKKMLEILIAHYNIVYIWIQGINDLEYLQSLIDTRKVRIIDRRLKAFEDILNSENVDYVGTRLHAGIFAMNHGIRSIIIAIDNRAKEMGHDVNLVLLEREEVYEKLETLIESEIVTDLRIPWDNIDKWKLQFKQRV